MKIGSNISEIQLPDTGQTTCFDGTGAVITCPLPDQPLAQDGSYNINPLSYTDNGDGTVTDNNTGLVWQKEDDGQTYNWYEANGIYDAQYNLSSMNVCGTLTVGGQTDWRVPSNEELLTLVNYNIAAPGPAIDPVFTGTQPLSYCTSKTLQSSPWAAVNVHFSSGSNQAYHKGTAIYVRCVKSGNSQSQNLTDNGDGTVSDSASGLTWQQEGPINMTWTSALSYCEELNLGNKTDWRLPNIKELMSLTLQDRYNPAIETNFFPNTYSTNYWSSTTMLGNPQVAWIVNFETGDIGHGGYGGNLYVRCVRGGQVSPPPPQFALRFPLENYTAYTAPVTSVQDHSMDRSYTKDGVVTAFNGEQAECLYGAKEYLSGKIYSGKDEKELKKLKKLCANISRQNGVWGYKKQGGGTFLSGILEYNDDYLFYDGHPGYDYDAKTGDPIQAPEDGILCVADQRTTPNKKKTVYWRNTEKCPMDTNVINTRWNKYHTFYILHDGYMTVFLHSDRLSDKVKADIFEYGYSDINKGDLIAVAGSFGAGQADHVHLEVFQKHDDQWVRVDPYGNGTTGVLWEQQ